MLRRPNPPNQDCLEGAGPAVAGEVAGAQHRPVANVSCIWGHGRAAARAGHGVPNKDLAAGAHRADEEGPAVAAVEELPLLVLPAARHAEERGGDAVGRIGGGDEAAVGAAEVGVVEEAEEGRRRSVEHAEVAEELRRGEEVAPALAHEGGLRQGGGARREATEDLGEGAVVVQRRREPSPLADGLRPCHFALD